MFSEAIDGTLLWKIVCELNRITVIISTQPQRPGTQLVWRDRLAPDLCDRQGRFAAYSDQPGASRVLALLDLAILCGMGNSTGAWLAQLFCANVSGVDAAMTPDLARGDIDWLARRQQRVASKGGLVLALAAPPVPCQRAAGRAARRDRHRGSR